MNYERFFMGADKRVKNAPDDEELVLKYQLDVKPVAWRPVGGSLSLPVSPSHKVYDDEQIVRGLSRESNSHCIESSLERDPNLVRLNRNINALENKVSSLESMAVKHHVYRSLASNGVETIVGKVKAGRKHEDSNGLVDAHPLSLNLMHISPSDPKSNDNYSFRHRDNEINDFMQSLNDSSTDEYLRLFRREKNGIPAALYIQTWWRCVRMRRRYSRVRNNKMRKKIRFFILWRKYHTAFCHFKKITIRKSLLQWKYYIWEIKRNKSLGVNNALQEVEVSESWKLVHLTFNHWKQLKDRNNKINMEVTRHLKTAQGLGAFETSDRLWVSERLQSIIVMWFRWMKLKRAVKAGKEPPKFDSKFWQWNNWLKAWEGRKERAAIAEQMFLPALKRKSMWRLKVGKVVLQLKKERNKMVQTHFNHTISRKCLSYWFGFVSMRGQTLRLRQHIWKKWAAWSHASGILTKKGKKIMKMVNTVTTGKTMNYWRMKASESTAMTASTRDKFLHDPKAAFLGTYAISIWRRGASDNDKYIFLSTWKRWKSFAKGKRNWRIFKFIYERENVSHLLKATFSAWRSIVPPVKGQPVTLPLFPSIPLTRSTREKDVVQTYYLNALQNQPIENERDENYLEHMLLHGSYTDSPSTDWVDDEQNTKLHIAADEGNDEEVQRLILEGMSPNVRNIHGDTPLHYASRHFSDVYIQIVVHLLECGTAPAAENNKGEAPANFATNNIVKKLLENHCERIKKRQFTPLERSAFRNYCLKKWTALMSYNLMWRQVSLILNALRCKQYEQEEKHGIFHDHLLAARKSKEMVLLELTVKDRIIHPWGDEEPEVLEWRTTWGVKHFFVNSILEKMQAADLKGFKELVVYQKEALTHKMREIQFIRNRDRELLARVFMRESLKMYESIHEQQYGKGKKKLRKMKLKSPFNEDRTITSKVITSVTNSYVSPPASPSSPSKSKQHSNLLVISSDIGSGGRIKFSKSTQLRRISNAALGDLNKLNLKRQEKAMEAKQTHIWKTMAAEHSSKVEAIKEELTLLKNKRGTIESQKGEDDEEIDKLETEEDSLTRAYEFQAKEMSKHVQNQSESMKVEEDEMKEVKKRMNQIKTQREAYSSRQGKIDTSYLAAVKEYNSICSHNDTTEDGIAQKKAAKQVMEKARLSQLDLERTLSEFDSKMGECKREYDKKMYEVTQIRNAVNVQTQDSMVLLQEITAKKEEISRQLNEVHSRVEANSTSLDATSRMIAELEKKLEIASKNLELTLSLIEDPSMESLLSAFSNMDGVARSDEDILREEEEARLKKEEEEALEEEEEEEKDGSDEESKIGEEEEV
jgi:hypothetical protein